MIPSKHKASAKRRPKSSSIPKHHDGKEYVVCLKDGIDYDKFWEEMETTIASPAEIPDRAVRIANERPNMKRICHYILTDEEAKRLRADGRVVSVDIPVDHKDGVVMMPHAVQAGNFNKPANTVVSTGSLVNWGLIRGNSTDNVYGTGNSTNLDYNYTMDGLGVDVVIVDTGIQADHPEFLNYNDNSRLQQINWFDASDTSPDFVQADNNETDIVVTADSEIFFDITETDAKLRIGTSNLAVENFSIQTENDGRALRMRFVGDSSYYTDGFNNVNWEVKLLDNNWIQVAILRHDAATKVSVEGIIQTTGDTSIVVKDIDTTDLFEGQLIRFSGNSQVWSNYHGTIRELGTYDGSSLIRTYAIDDLDNPVIGDLDDLIVGLRLERQTDLGGGSINGDALITELNLNGNEVNYTADGSTIRYLVAERPINQRNIIVDLDGNIQALYNDYTIAHEDGNTYVDFYSPPIDNDPITISFAPSLVFETTASCDQGPLVFDARTGSGNDFLIDSIDSATQITMSGYDGGAATHGYAYMYVGSVASNPSWSLTNEYGDVIIDLSDLADPSLFGPEATPVSFLLKSDNDGVTWTRQGGIGNNYRAALVNDVWTAQAGLAATSNSPLSTVLIDGYDDYTEANFNTPFDFKVPFTGFVPELHYTDVAGHGTHVAGITAGRTYGWAKNARIFALKMKDLSGNGGLSESEMFDAIIGWHNNKTNGRPTVVNMSWGYGGYYADFDITGGSYRGFVWSDNEEKPEYGMGDLGTFPIRNSSTDTGIEEMITAGIHVCISSGNDGVKIDVPGGPDYNNYFVFTDGMGTDFYYYQKGSSPYSKHALMVGSLDLEAYDVNQDQKVDYSNGGPGTDIYAAGTGILSSMSTVNTLADEGYEDAPFHQDSDYKQANLSGTSMASPQIAGMIALFLQANPHATPAEMKAWVLANAGNSMYDYGSSGMDYETANSPWGGAPIVVYNKFNSLYSMRIRNIGD